MLYLDELREFEENISTDEKTDVILNYLKNMKDSYEAYFKSLERRIEELESKLT